MNNKGLLIVIALAVIGIFSVVVYEASQDSPSEEMAENVSQITENVGDEIDEATE